MLPAWALGADGAASLRDLHSPRSFSSGCAQQAACQNKAQEQTHAGRARGGTAGAERTRATGTGTRTVPDRNDGVLQGNAGGRCQPPRT